MKLIKAADNKNLIFLNKLNEGFYCCSGLSLLKQSNTNVDEVGNLSEASVTL